MGSARRMPTLRSLNGWISYSVFVCLSSLQSIVFQSNIRASVTMQYNYEDTSIMVTSIILYTADNSNTANSAIHRIISKYTHNTYNHSSLKLIVKNVPRLHRPVQAGIQPHSWTPGPCTTSRLVRQRIHCSSSSVIGTVAVICFAVDD